MALDLNHALANALLDQYDVTFPAGSVVEMRSAADGLLASIPLPATPWLVAAASVKAKAGEWVVAAATSGTIARFRLRNAADTLRDEGTVTVTGGGGDMTLDAVDVLAGQVIVIDTFTRTL